MLALKIQEPQSCWANSAPNRSFRNKFLVLLLIQMLFGVSMFGSQAVPTPDLVLFSSTAWMFELTPSAGPNGYLEVTYTAGQQTGFPNGSVFAELSQEGATISIQVEGWENLPEEFTGRLAIVEVFDGSTGQVLHRYAVQADGGEVIVVLMDD